MIFIAHRGNIDGSNPRKENTKSYIKKAIENGFDVEVDVWLRDGNLFLGHDFPKEKVEPSFFCMCGSEHIWCHAKDAETLHESYRVGMHCFFHETDGCVFTSLGYIWTYPGKKLTPTSICVKPTFNSMGYPDQDFSIAHGVCSDYIANVKEYWVGRRDDIRRFD